MPVDDYRIRPPLAPDKTRWRELWQGYLEFYRASLPVSVTDQLWRRLLDPADSIQGRVAVADNDLLGLVHFFPHAHTWYPDPVCYLNDLYVSPAARGGGIGAALIQAVVDAGKEQGWAEVYWHTQQDNTVARGLYDKLTGGSDGFVNYTIALGP